MERQLIIKRAAQIYCTLIAHEDKLGTKIIRKFSSDSLITKKTTSKEKAYLCIFLASLMVNSRLKKMLNKYGLRIELFEDSLGFNIYNLVSDDSFEVDHISKSLFYPITREFNYEHLSTTSEEYLNSPELLFNSVTNISKLVLELLKKTGVVNAELSIRSNGACNAVSNYLSEWRSRDTNAYFEKVSEDAKNKYSKEYEELLGPLLMKKESSLINKYGLVLNDKEYPFNPSIGRKSEINKIMRTLLTPEKSVILIGEPGVGKTAIVDGLAYSIKNALVPAHLSDYKIIKINTTTLVSGCSYVGMIEERMEDLLDEIKESKKNILFIDEVHTLIGAGAGSKSTLDIANILKPYLDRGEIRIIGATTNSEYNEHIASDSAFNRRFEKIEVLEPATITLKEIIASEFAKLTEYYGTLVEIDCLEELYELLIACTVKNARTGSDNNPDLVISIINNAFSLSVFNNTSLSFADFKVALLESPKLNTATVERLISNFEKDNVTVKETSKVIRLKK